MRIDLTDLTIVIDRSGSMSACKKDAEGGVNEFIKKQQEAPGECTFSLVQFDNVYEFVHKARPIRDITLAYAMEPRGSTALLDAIGQAITETGERLKSMKEEDRPGLVVFVIVTDGEENSSRKFSAQAIKEMIDRQTNVYKWQFTYLGANQDSFTVANNLGILSSANYAGEKTSGALLAAASNVIRMRHACATETDCINEYTDDERIAMS